MKLVLHLFYNLIYITYNFIISKAIVSLSLNKKHYLRYQILLIMKNSIKLFLLFTILSQTIVFSQEKEKLSLNKGSIEDQFNFVINKSNSYKDNKVIKKSWVYTLKSHTLDSITKEKNTIIEANKIIEKQKSDYHNLQIKLTELNKKLDDLTHAKDTISVLGINIKKNLFKTIMSLIIALLLISLLYFIYIYKNSNKITKKTLTDYDELETEFNQARTRALEREQSLNRRLQDEINRQKK